MIRMNRTLLAALLCAAGAPAAPVPKPTSPKKTVVLPGGKHMTVRSVSWSPDGTRIAVARSDSTILLWDARGKLLREWKAHLKQLGTKEKPRYEPGLGSVEFSPDGKELASCGSGQAIRFWDAETGKEKGAITRVRSQPDSLAYSRDGKSLLGWSQYCARIWPREDGKVSDITRTGTGSTKRSNGTITPDGIPLVVSGDAADQSLSVQRIDTGKTLYKCADHRGAWCEAFSPDGRFLGAVSKYGDGVFRVWDAPTGKLVSKWTPPSHLCGSPCFTPDGEGVILPYLAGSPPSRGLIVDRANGRSSPRRLAQSCGP